jgi:two-component system, chemotaxis family, sensor kinase Cph1
LIAVNEKSGRITQFAVAPGDLSLTDAAKVGSPWQQCVPVASRELLGAKLPKLSGGGSVYLGVAQNENQRHHVIAHRSGETTVVEFERAIEGEPRSFEEVYPFVRDFLASIQQIATVDDVAAFAAKEVRRITGLDRALVYKFDENWNGAVVAEDRNDVLPSYLGLRFPASDIPEQARRLYHQNRLRLIADVNYRPAPLTPEVDNDGQPLDLSLAVLRSVSPIHLEYMRNMGTAASMSIALMSGDRLWGLISCHNQKPARVPYHVRIACDFIGQVLSMQIAAKEHAHAAEQRNHLRPFQTRLFAQMARAKNFVEGLVVGADDLLALTGSQGVAIVSKGACTLIGDTPFEHDVRRLVEWLSEQERQDVFVTDSLAGVMPKSRTLVDRASGVLAISISQIHDSFVVWFRPELVKTVNWGGDPRKDQHASERLNPRRSFEAWQEIVREKSQPWADAEVDAAAELRTAIVDIVLRNAEEMAALSERLRLINRELEAFSYSVSHDLRAPFRHIVGYAQLLKKHVATALDDRGSHYIETIIESAISAGRLVDDLLSFSQMGRATITPVAFSMADLIGDAVKRFSVSTPGRTIEWHIGSLPIIHADPSMMKLVVQNLVDNAIKFTRNKNPAEISISHRIDGDDDVFAVRDNGSGFDQAYVHKLFGVFQRLHRAEEFEGTGIGLANVKRIINRHGGRVWAEGEVGKGATLTFTLPRRRA